MSEEKNLNTIILPENTHLLTLAGYNIMKNYNWRKRPKKKKKNCGSQNTQDVSLHNLDGYSFIWAKHTEGFSMFVLQLIHTYDIISKKQPAIPTFKAANHEKLLSTTMILLNHK